MDLILSITAFLVLFVGGVGLTLLIVPRSYAINAIELLSLSFLFGLSFVSLASFYLGLFSAKPILLPIITVGCIGVGIIGITARLRSKKGIVWSLPSSISRLLLVSILVIQVAVVIWLCLRQGLGWDALLIWENKARLASLNGGIMPTSYFSDPSRGWSHPEYPLLLPLTETWLYSWLGRCDQELVKLIFPLFYIAAINLLLIGGSRLSGQPWRGAVPALLLFFVPLTVIKEGSVSSGYADFPLAVFYLASVIYLLEYWETGANGALRLFGILSGILPWIKQDGIILWLCLVTLATIKIFQRREARLLLLILLPGALVFSGWKIFLRSFWVPIETVFLPLNVMTVWSNIGRGPIIVQAVANEMLNWAHWSLLWPGLFLTIPLFIGKTQNKRSIVLILTVAMPIILYAGIYFFSALSPFTDHIGFSLPRLLMHVSLVALLIIGLAMPVHRLRVILPRR